MLPDGDRLGDAGRLLDDRLGDDGRGDVCTGDGRMPPGSALLPAPPGGVLRAIA